MTSGMRKAVLFVLLAGLTYIAYNYMIKPANRDLTAQKARITQNKKTLRELEKATVAADDLSKQRKRVEEAIAAFESKLPPSSEIHTVLKNVTLIARKHNLTPKTIRAMKPKENNGYIEQPLKMELHGNFNSYYSFLLEFEKMDRITKIRELSLKKESKHEGYTEATFIVSIFFQGTKV